jgi:hypothetical protein
MLFVSKAVVYKKGKISELKRRKKKLFSPKRSLGETRKKIPFFPWRKSQELKLLTF